MAGQLARRLENVTIEDARIVFRNFSGKEGQYNREGDRNFSVLLSDETGDRMQDEGWNVKPLKSREEGEPPTPYIQVAVSFKGRPPRVVMITSRGRTNLDESLVDILDWVDIANVDLIINPYVWNVNGKTGVKAYLHAIYITIREDALELKYADVPDSAMSAIEAPQRLELTSSDEVYLDEQSDGTWG